MSSTAHKKDRPRRTTGQHIPFDLDIERLAMRIEAEVTAGRMTLEEAHDWLREQSTQH